MHVGDSFTIQTRDAAQSSRPPSYVRICRDPSIQLGACVRAFDPFPPVRTYVTVCSTEDTRTSPGPYSLSAHRW